MNARASSLPAAPGARGSFVSLGTKLAAAMMAVVMLVSAGIFLEVSARERESLVHAKTAEAAAVADLFALTVAAPLDFGDADAVRAELANLQANRDVVYAGAWLAGVKEPVAELLREGAAGARPGDAALGKASLVTSDASVDVARPVKNLHDKVVGATFIRFSLAPENAAYAQTRRSLFWMCLGMATGTVALLIFIARRQIMTPIEGLLAAVRKVQHGEGDAEVTIRAHDEIGRLAIAFNEMHAAIRDREERLAAANKSLQGLFDNMRQAIVVFAADGKVVSAGSRTAATAFGGEVEGRRLVDLLYPGVDSTDPEASALEQWIELVFSAPTDQWEELVTFAPQEIVFSYGQPDERVLVLEFRPIVGDTDDAAAPLSRVMLLATDETEKRRLVREVQTKGEAHEREMGAMRQLLVGRGEAFVLFLERGHERLLRCAELLGQSKGDPRGGPLDEMLAHAHTVKGEARAFDLGDLANAMSGLEEQLRNLRATARGEAVLPETSDAIAESLSSADAMFDRASRLFVQVSPLGEAALDRTTVRRSDVQRLVEIAGSKGEVAELAARLASRPFGEAASILAEKVPTWAEALGKQARLIVEGRDVLVPPALARVLGGVLTHLVRNAIAHGIEAPIERQDHDKPIVGDLRVRCDAGEHGPTIVVDDDGAGLQVEAILELAKSMGLHREGVTAEALIFETSFSTNEGGLTEAAGLGVGLAAVRKDLEGAGYAITLGAASGAGTRFVISPKGQSAKLPEASKRN